MKLGIVVHLVCLLAWLAPGGWSAPVYGQAQSMAVAEVPEATESERAPAPAPDGEALRNLAARLAQPAPSNEADTPAPASEASASQPALPQREAQPLGTSSRLGEVVDQAEFTTGNEGWVLNTLAALGLVIGLILLLRWGWARMGGVVVARSTPAVEVLSRTAVAPRNHVLLVRVGGRILVLGDSSGGLRTLAVVEDPDEVANLLEAVTTARNNSVTRGFMQLLHQTDERYDKVRLHEEGGDHGEYRIDRARDSVSGLLARVKALSGKEGE